MAALSRPYSKRTKAELVDSLLDAVKQYKDSHVQGEGAQGQRQGYCQNQGVSEVATGDLEVSREAAYCLELTCLLLLLFPSDWPVTAPA